MISRSVISMADVIDARAAFRRVVFDQIDRAATPSERKERIMIAWQTGHLDAAEAAQWIAVAGLDAA